MISLSPLPFRCFFAQGPAAEPALQVVDVRRFNSSANHSSLTGDITPLAPADAVLFLWQSRANGGGQTFAAPTLTIGGTSAARVAGNNDTATTDFFPIVEVFYLRKAFVANEAVSFAWTLGGNGRPGGAHVVFLSGSRAETTAAASVGRATTSGATISLARTPAAAGSLMFSQAAHYVSSGTPALDSYSPEGHIPVGGMAQNGNTLGGAWLYRWSPEDTAEVTPTFTFTANSSQRGISVVELVR